MQSLKIAVGMAVVLGLGCVTGPNNGATYGGSIVGAAFYVSGYWVNPGVSVDVQVLSAPTADPAVDANWSTLATTTSGSTATVINGDALYPWGLTVVPVPTSAVAGRWPAGGLVKLRARGRDSSGTYNAYTFDDVTWSDCAIAEYGAGTSGENIGLHCQGLGRGAVAMVSTANNPADLGARDFLTIKGDISAAETESYYATWGAPTTLAAFRSTFLYPGSGDVTASYYNDGDLGIGREMHCWQYTRSFGFITGTACYVSNYSDDGTFKFGINDVNATLNNTVNHLSPFATVAMDTEHSIFSSTPGPVNFVAYNGGGARVDAARLDNRNLHTSIPNNCLTCHGVDAYYDSTAHGFIGRANFLPFDLAAYRYSGAAGYTRAAQEEAFRRLNLTVRDATAPTYAITSLINGAYADTGGVGAVNARWNDAYVPADWLGGSTKDFETLYKGVVRPYCRTCHISAGPGRDFAESADFANLKSGIAYRACQTSSAFAFMPHAEHPFRKFWASGARAYLNAWTGDTTGCKP